MSPRAYGVLVRGRLLEDSNKFRQAWSAGSFDQCVFAWRSDPGDSLSL